jgi:hypothetical protein
MNTTPLDERVWKIMREHPDLTSPAIAHMLGAEVSAVAGAMKRAGTPREIRTGASERQTILETGLELTVGDRNETYGPPYVNLDATAQMLSAYITAKFDGATITETFRLTAEDVAHFMQLVKMARTFHGAYHRDNYIDNAAYAAIAGECRLTEEEA